MYIQEIELNHFRNYEEQKIELSPHINIFYGDNGEGKTNILEAIFLSSIGRSFRTNKEKEMIAIGENKALVSMKYEKKDRDGSVKLILEDKKSVFVNGIKIKKLSELYDIYICSSCVNPFDIKGSGRMFADKFNFLIENLSFIKPGNFIFTSAKH